MVWTDFITGKEIKIPEPVKEILATAEAPQCTIQMARKAQITAPDSLILTSERIICYKPVLFGLKKNIEDYRYDDIANVKAHKGFMSASLVIKPRFMSDEIHFDNIPKGSVDKVYRQIQENIRNAQAPLQAQVKQASAETGEDDPLKLLKLRFVKGEITKDEYEEMKEMLLK